MKKVALVTCYFQPNYGSMLQALATQQILNEWGIENETICIDGFKGEIRAAKMKYFRSRMFSIDVFKDKLGFIKLKIAKKLHRSLARNCALREEQFERFSKSSFSLSKEYPSIKDLGAHAEEYSAFLVGSDQLWLPSNIAADYYTLNFVPDHVRKIAYATSFGVTSLPKAQAAKAKTFLPRIDFLSVRERSGADLIRALTGLEAQVVCDPTLLLSLNEWRELVKPERRYEESYIFCYFLGNNPLARDFARKLKDQTGYKIVALQQIDAYVKSDETFGDVKPYDVNPADFVNLIANAEYVCTDSFHGTVFAILNHKPFFTFRRHHQKSKMSTNNRIDSLLQILGLEDRIVGQPNGNFDCPIDYAAVDEKREAFRSASLQFLRQALEHED